MTSITPADRGLTDPLDGLVPRALHPLLTLVDDRAGMRVDDDGVHLRQLLRTRTIPWDEITSIHLQSRLDVALGAGTRFLPVGRIPVVGRFLSGAVREAASFATKRLAPGPRRQAGWSVATIEREGLLQRDVDVEGGAFLTALFADELLDTLVAQANMRHIPVHHD